MPRKWRPSRAQRQEFAANMTDPDYANAYYARRQAADEKRRKGSKYDYSSAGGKYKPTEGQYQAAMKIKSTADLSGAPELAQAADRVIYGYTCNETIHHDFIHLINEWIRTNNINNL